MWPRILLFCLLAVTGWDLTAGKRLLEDHELQNVVKLSDMNHLRGTVEKILVPRVVGSDGHNQVKEFIKNTLNDYGWTVQTDVFQEKTPNLGILTFENIIAYSNLNAEKYLLISAHYDSKYYEKGEFLGATDSAVPCAMMLNLMETLKTSFDQIKSRTDLGIVFVFFDGEEAFLNWSATDSIYGARHLAQRWENEGFLPKIELFVLLDLLGAPDPSFFSYFKNTQESYTSLMTAEDRLLKAGFLDQYSYSSVADRGATTYFQPHTVGVGIEDDHIPFLRRGVPILHLIPTPFPSVWHTFNDDGQAIDYTTVENLNRILRLFVIEYLNLPF